MAGAGRPKLVLGKNKIRTLKAPKIQEVDSLFEKALRILMHAHDSAKSLL